MAASTQAQDNWQIGLYGSIDVPIRSEMPKMSTNLGAGAQLSYRPIRHLPFYVELGGSFGQYSSRTSEETFVFSDGSSTVTDVSFSSRMHKIQLGTKFYYTGYYRPVRGYVTPQIGYAFMKSRIRIEDPEDEDGCRPLDNQIRQRSGDFTYGLELGAEFDMRKIIRGEDRPEQRLFVSASFLGSFHSVDYVNVRYMNEHEHGISGDDHSHMDMDEDRDLTVEFVNLATDNIHEHKVAELYRTPLRFVTINIGYRWYF